MHAIYLFNEAGRPDLTQKWVRWALTDRYGTGPNGLDGNDDGGTLLFTVQMVSPRFRHGRRHA